MDENRLTVKEAAELMNVSEQFVRVGLQKKQLPIGWAVKTSTQWTYYIPKPLFEQVTGIKA